MTVKMILGDRLIKTKFEYPPIPDRSCDWSAVTDDYEGGDPIGRGATETEAIDDLIWQLTDSLGE